MTPGSNHPPSVSRKAFERNLCSLCGKRRCEKILSDSRIKDQKNPKSPSFGDCLRLFFKDRARMEPQAPHKDSYTELTERRLRELASKWFVETQVPLIVHNGFFPSWFLGFITREDAEEILREKKLGYFLVRLSAKAIGYILSYKGRDRCRHFVINQTENGQFVVCGDDELHDTVPDLIEYYKTNPIEPFREYLTSSCFEVMTEELYDTIHISPKEKTVETQRASPQTQPPRSDMEEEVPPLPQRSRHLDVGSPHDQDRLLYAQLNKQSPRESPRTQNCQRHLPEDNVERADRSTARDHSVSRCSTPSRPDVSSDVEHHYRLNVPPQTPPRLSPKPIRQPTSSNPWSQKTAPSSLNYMGDSAVYYLAGSPHTALSESSSLPLEQQSDLVYDEVPSEGIFSQEDIYEMIPGSESSVHPKLISNTYEPLEDVRPKVVKNDKWKWLFPDAKRKW
ncbi:hypothetical protein JOB18_018853 [Solea senegalensis]|uniref:SH2 domain-containing protein n=1 Tax=Solea senegalensis TaxID=28829 RepID=A0AAV6SYE3_SOLSE|nr:SH2 domain-containing protein 7-like [Solea senegalensis]KAG7522302.1 hypothetical protein JOB18_018853 [Solea senegalensis]